MRLPATSLRWRLSLTYAAIALLTAAVLGAVLVALLDRHFTESDDRHLRSVADKAATELVTATADEIGQRLRMVAYTMNTRVQALDASRRTVADSGSPPDIAPDSIGPVAGVNRPSDKETRSRRTYTRLALPGSPAGVRFLQVSEGPASGGGVMNPVVTAWALAAVAAVTAAAATGYLLSRRLTRPLTQLTSASDRMRAGDLSARASEAGHDEIGRLAHSFNQMADKVAATVTALQRFVSDAAHQLGTPLTALRTDLETLRRDARSHDERRRIDRALAQQKRLEALSGGLLQLSRLESATATPPARTVALLPLIRASLDAVASRAEQADVDLDLTADSDPYVSVLPNHVTSAVDNLLDNALKFTPAGGAIHVGVATERAHALVWIHDTGPGIPAEDHDRVFDRFYRSRVTADQPGTGLGLAIAKALTHTTGGSLHLAPSDHGTRMELRLPLAPSAPPQRVE